MTVGIIGAGNIGGTIAKLAVAAGHKVVISNSRGPDTLKDLVTQLGANAKAGTPADAVAQGDVVVLAIPFQDRDSLFKHGPSFKDKIVVDAMNPYSDKGEIIDLGGQSSAEIVARELPGARVVKAFNTLYYGTLASRGRPKGSPDRIMLPVASDDADAKRTVSSFIDSIGFDPFDVGSLANGRKQEPKGALAGKTLTLAQAQRAAG